jgi:hypothetical protein
LGWKGRKKRHKEHRGVLKPAVCRWDAIEATEHKQLEWSVYKPDFEKSLDGARFMAHRNR